VETGKCASSPSPSCCVSQWTPFIISLLHNWDAPLPKSLSSLLEDSKNYSFLLSIFVFATLLVQSVLKAIAYESGHSKVKNHQECLILLGAMEVTTDLIEEGNLTPNQVLQTQHLREQD
jgi:hypothetical protein